MYCSGCGANLDDRHHFCPDCGQQRQALAVLPPKEPATTTTSKVTVGRIVGIVTAIAFVVFLLGSILNPIGQEADTRSGYRSQTLAYFYTLTETGGDLARAMTHADELKPDRLKRVILTTQAVERSAYEKYSVGRGTASAATEAGDIANSTNYVHQNFQKAMGELLAFWDDSDTRHVIAGGADLKQALAEANATVEKINAQR